MSKEEAFDGSTTQVPGRAEGAGRAAVAGVQATPADRHLARDLGVHPEALRTWIRQDQADHGERSDQPTTEQLEELRRLRRENVELKRVNEILKAASAVFAQELDPTRRRS